MTGMVLGERYEIIEEIGNGGMAHVYKARCRLLNRFVAVKILRQEFAKDREFLARFNAEAQAAAALSHQNIVSIYDVGREGDIEYIVMEYVEGMTLKEYIQKNKILSWQKTVDFAIQICSALICAHGNGIVHRDIKPQNIIITPDRVLKVTDFGIARAATASSVTITGNAMGSVHYLSPEQARGGYTDFKSDIYSLGIVMYEMVTGRLPFEGDTPVSIAIKQIQEKPVSPKEYNIAVPLAVEGIILKALNKDQSQRFQTAGEMMRELQQAKIQPEAAIDAAEAGDIDNGQTKKIPVVTPNNNGNPKPTPPPPPRRDGKMDKSEKKAVVWAVITSVVLVCALIVGAIAVLVPGAFGGSSDVISVPDLEGKAYEDVKDAYAGQGISITPVQTVSSDKYEKGAIVSQNPKAGKQVKAPFEIEVTLSGGIKAITLENYERKSFIETKLALEGMGIKVSEVKEESDTIAEGMIIRTSPGANAALKEGDTVVLYVSSGAGEKKVLMPNLVELSLQQAKKLIAENSLLEGTITEVASNKPKGTVVEQGVPANSEVKAYSRIDLSVSKGEELKSKPISITVPQTSETTSVKVVQDGTVIHNEVHRRSEGAFDIVIKGNGAVKLEVYYDNVLSKTMMVNL